MNKPISFRMSSNPIVFGPIPFYFIALFSILFLALSSFLHQTERIPYLVFTLSVGLFGIGSFVYGYFKWRDRFLTVSDVGIVLMGVSIPWKYIESYVKNGALWIHVTDASAVNLHKLPWPFASGSRRSMLLFSILNLSRSEVRLPWWLFEGSFAEAVTLFQVSEPKATPEYLTEKAEAKQRGAAFSRKEYVMIGTILTIVVLGFVGYLFVSGAPRPTEVLFLAVILVGAYWVAILT